MEDWRLRNTRSGNDHSRIGWFRFWITPGCNARSARTLPFKLLLVQLLFLATDQGYTNGFSDIWNQRWNGSTKAQYVGIHYHFLQILETLCWQHICDWCQRQPLHVSSTSQNNAPRHHFHDGFRNRKQTTFLRCTSTFNPIGDVWSCSFQKDGTCSHRSSQR